MDELEQIKESISKLAEVCQMLCEKVDWHDEQLDKMNTSKVYDRLDSIESDFGSMVGGLNDIIDGRHKREYADGFREKHPEFGRYEDIGKRFGLDVFGTAADTTFGMPDEEREGAVGAMLEELKSKFDDLIAALEKNNAHEAAETPTEEKAEHEGGEEKAEIEQPDEGPDAKIIKIAGQFKNRRAG